MENTDDKVMPHSSTEREYFRLLFDMAADCLLVLDTHGKIVEINQAGCDQRGYTREEMLGRSISEFDPPEFAAKVPERMKGLFRDGQARFESAHVCKDDTVMPVEINCRVIELNGERRVFSVIRDISRQKEQADLIAQGHLKLDEQFNFLRAVLNNAPMGLHIYRLEEEGQLIFVGFNSAAERILGVEHQQFVGKTIEQAFPRLTTTEVPAQYRRLAESGGEWKTGQIEYHEGRINGAFAIRAFQTAPGQMAVFFEDITASKQAEEDLKVAASVYQISSEAMLVTDAETRVISVNPAFISTTGYTEAEMRGRNPSFLSSGRHDKGFYLDMWKSINESGHWRGEIWNRRKNGEVFAEFLAINTIFDEDGKVFRRVGLFTDITEKKRTEELIWRQANFDTLTGLPNRRMFRDRLELELKNAKRDDQIVALLFIDLDRFKEVNDTLGHHVGDELLVQAAQRLTSCVRSTDTIARLGGDEFTVILSRLHNTEDIEQLTRNIIHKLAEPYRLGKETAHVSASVGITVFPTDTTQIEQLLQNADQAMYLAKEQGRNCFSFFTPSLHEAAMLRLRMLGELKNALETGQLRVYFQPIVELPSGQIFKAEALLRWLHPQHGLVSPMAFIPLAEETGLIIPIGDWVFRESARYAKRWSDLVGGAGFQISVNKSPVQFRSKDCSPESWIDYLHEIGLSGHGIAVEITEGLLLNRDDDTAHKLLQFRDAGIQISMDDFGTGYSSLSYLKKFDIDYLKIDQSFVRNMVSDPADQALCEAIVVMAHKLGLKVVAEGVETKEQRDLLIDIGCDFAQGYLFSRPIPAEEFEAMLKRLNNGKKDT